MYIIHNYIYVHVSYMYVLCTCTVAACDVFPVGMLLYLGQLVLHLTPNSSDLCEVNNYWSEGVPSHNCTCTCTYVCMYMYLHIHVRTVHVHIRTSTYTL